MSGRHGVAPRSRATAVLLGLAAAGGLWFGINAADVSPVAVPAAAVPQTQTDDPATTAPADGRGPGADRGADGGPGDGRFGGPGGGGGR
jgi:hypothetical protein